MRVLIIKLSSMGDLIHTLPALTDASHAFPNIQFDWVAEEAFAEIPTWHKQVKQVLPIALRRWRKQIFKTLQTGELKNFIKQLRLRDYNYIIDAQSSIKSAVITRLARGTRYGMDANSVREKPAHWAYQKQFFINRDQHALTRLRELFSKIFNYPLPTTSPDYGLNQDRFASAPITLPNDYLIFLPHTAWATKIWPETYWQTLLKKTTQAGFNVLIPWGNAAEKNRAEFIAQGINNAIVLPKLSLSQMASVISSAKAAVCCDTGLAHLAAALNIPAITLYGPTDPKFIGTFGASQLHLTAQFPCAPCKQRQCTYQQPSEQKPACFTTLQPELVWQNLEQILH